MKVSITLPSIFPAALDRALANIRATTRGDYEVVVVSPFRVEADDVVWIEEIERNGCAFAHTVAAQHATGDFITAMADDCDYAPGWDLAALENYERRAPKDGSLFCLGLNYGAYVGTVFGIYYPNFPFLRRDHAISVGYYDGNYKRGFGDCDLALKIWSRGGRCEFSGRQLLLMTAEDARKGHELSALYAPEDLEYFAGKWAPRYGRGFGVSSLRAFNIDIDPVLRPALVKDFSIFENSPDFVMRATARVPKPISPLPTRIKKEAQRFWRRRVVRGAAVTISAPTRPRRRYADDGTNLSGYSVLR